LSDPIDELRKRVQDKIARLQGTPASSGSQTKVLGELLDAALATSGRSRADFARHLRMEPVLADAILDGLLPAPEIDDETLVDMARFVNLEPNLLRLALGRSVTPAPDEGNASKHA
jgi:hypothetical protein